MTNEEFQKIVLEELRDLNGKVDKLDQGQVRLEERQTKLEEGQVRLEERQTKLEERQAKLEERQIKLEEGQEEIKRDLKAICEQTADLTEFREEINVKIDKLTEDFSTIEMVTSKNWSDIVRLKAARVI